MQEVALSKTALAALLASALMAPICLAQQDRTFNDGLRDLVHDIVSNGKLGADLKTSKFAVLGFRDQNSDQGCRALSRSLANQVQDELDRYSGVIYNVANESFRLATRQEVLPIEDECSMIDPKNCAGMDTMFAPSDVLITGTWDQHDDNYFRLTLSALRMGDQRGTETLARSSDIIPKRGLNASERSCLDASLQPRPDPLPDGSVVVGPDSKPESKPEPETAPEPVLNLSGNFHGTLTLSEQFLQESGLSDYTGPRSASVQIQLTHTGESVSGTTEVTFDPNAPVAYQLTGALVDGTLSLQGQHFIEPAPNPASGACMISASLTLQDPTGTQLRGQWGPNPGVAGGCQTGYGDIALTRQ